MSTICRHLVDRGELSSEDAAFLEAFETATLPDGAFRHRQHLRMAWLYLRLYGEQAGTARIVQGIKRFAAAKGATMLYHETVTRFWVRLLLHAQSLVPQAGSFDEVVDAHPGLLDKTLLARHYRPETLASARARATWVDPDLAPLPF